MSDEELRTSINAGLLYQMCQLLSYLLAQEVLCEYYSLHLTQLHTSCLASCQGGTVIADISLVQEGKTDRALWATISYIFMGCYIVTYQ